MDSEVSVPCGLSPIAIGNRIAQGFVGSSCGNEGDGSCSYDAYDELQDILGAKESKRHGTTRALLGWFWSSKILVETPQRPLQVSRYPFRMIQVRKLVAVELIFLGPKIVFAEYGFAVVVGTAIGVLSLRVGLLRTHAAWQVLLGIYLLFLALTYGVLFGLGIAMARRGDAREEVAGEFDKRPATFRKYRKQSLWILVPLVVPLAALRQRWVMDTSKS